MRTSSASATTSRARVTSSSSASGRASAARPSTLKSSSRSRTSHEPRGGEPQLRAFLLHLAAERELAENTIIAYRRDLEDLSDYFRTRRRTLTNADVEDYLTYLRRLRSAKKATKTIARRIAAIRVFLRYLAGEGTNVDRILQQIER